MSEASAATRLILRLKLAAAWVGFSFLRGCERLLPTGVLSLLLWPPAAAWDLVQVRQRKLVTRWRQFPESWHPKPARFFLRQSLGLYHPQLIYTWPDRLSTPRWLSRCRLEGGSELIGSREGDRGVVFASVHFGAPETLPYWLRAHGIVTTMIRGRPASESLKSLASYQYSLSLPADVQLFLDAKDFIPLPRFARIGKFLRPGRRLLVMVDVDRGPQFHVPFGNRLFRMASGAISFAALAGADLIPCLIVEPASWKFVIHFGAPVPRGYLGRSPDMQAAGAHLLAEFSKVISRYPEQCKSRFLSAMLPLPMNGVSDPSAVAHAGISH
jgi:lauroyl/myristoyl acyltransferase